MPAVGARGITRGGVRSRGAASQTTAKYPHRVM